MSERPQSEHQLPVAVKAHREQTINALCEHFANDALTIEEFERRLDVATRALTTPELESLLSDLPALASAKTPAQAAPPMPPRPMHHARPQQTLVALMGGVERRGRWQPAQKTIIIAMMGGAELDFREVVLPAGETEVTVLCMMGGIEVIVPPGMNVDCGGIAIMGGFEHVEHVAPPHDPNAPVLRINGFVMMGGVEVQVRHPGETPKDMRQRLREEQRRLKDARKQR